MKAMASYVSSRCSPEAHDVASVCFSRQSRSLAFGEHKCYDDTSEVTRLSRSAPLQIQKFSTELFCRNARLRSCRSVVSQKDYFVTSIVTPEFHGFSLSAAHRPTFFGVSNRFECRLLLNCGINAALRSSSSKCRMNISGEMPDLRQRIPTAAGDNAAMETSYGPNAEVADTQNHSDKDVANAASPPGIICPSVTTVGKSTNIVWQDCMVKREERQKLLGQKGCVIWITGLSGSGKSTLACTLDRALLDNGKLSYVLDGDNVRHGLNKNLGFSAEDRAENIRRIGEVAKVLVDAGVICIASAISPYRKDRDACRKLLKSGEFIEVYMNFPLKLCEERDPKGLYKLARAGIIKGFTGVDDPYETPLNCEVVMELIDGKCPSPAEMAAQLVSYLECRDFLNYPL